MKVCWDGSLVPLKTTHFVHSIAFLRRWAFTDVRPKAFPCTVAASASNFRSFSKLHRLRSTLAFIKLFQGTRGSTKSISSERKSEGSTGRDWPEEFRHGHY